MYTATRLLEIAAAEVGYREKETNAQLDNPTANAGDEDYTKYARDLRAAGYYNGNKNGYAWCDVFVDWCFFQLCNKDAAKAQEIICQTGPYGAGCKWSAMYYRNQGRFYSNGPQPGDQVFFNNYAHTGIVEKVEGDKIHTIEGNTSNRVARRTYSINSDKIDGYGRPKYDVEQSETPEPPQPEEPWVPKEGDIVYFTGNTHYRSANAKKGYSCKPGEAKITRIYRLGKSKHPYQLIRVSGKGATVYGWVDEGSFVKK